ncbi:MAG TPA: GGDEF domain-containing protein, partial [Longimicrobiaceae bacterium]|nr:GGDEF domain-containing protein [Longimicrobiaceae bacterium]
GDEVLRIVAGILHTSLRGQDVPARLGGDEFAVVLPETNAEPALRVMERLRARVEEHMRDFDWPVTCSVGVVTAPHAQLSFEELIRRADDLMYQVKHEGKNALRQEVVKRQ